jgi:hypothetical protein
VEGFVINIDEPLCCASRELISRTEESEHPPVTLKKWCQKFPPPHAELYFRTSVLETHMKIYTTYVHA